MADYGGVSTTEYHEMWHAKQAADFRAKGWVITEENKIQYLHTLNAQCRKNVDMLGVNAYNVRDISRHAAEQFIGNRYDEVEADIMVKRRTSDGNKKVP